MANEFKHTSVGSQLSQTEYEAVGGHVLDSQAAGDIIYASSTSQLSRLEIGTAGKVLEVSSGLPAWTAAITGATSILNAALVIGRDADNDIDFATDNTILFRAEGADQIKLINGVLAPVADNDIDLGTSSLEFKDAFFDGTVTSDAFAGPLTGDVTGNADTATALATGRTIGMTGDVVWTSASFTGAGNVTGSATIQSTSVESGMLNNNIISGQTEITSGLADADELLYSDGGVIKRVGLDTLTSHIQSGVDGDITGVTALDADNPSPANNVAGDGLSASSAVMAVDLGTNSGLEISSNKLQIAKGISQHDVAQFTSGVADDDFLRVAGTVVEGRSATEVLSDIGASAVAGSSSIVTVGAVNAGSITSGFTSIDVGAGAISTTGTASAGIVDIAQEAHLDSSPADETVSGVTATFTAGEALVRGEVVYYKASDSKMHKAVATAAATSRCVAMAAADISADATGKFLLYGFLQDNGSFPAYTIGGTLFTPEAETSSQNVPEQTAPDTDGDFVQVLGFAVTANSVFFNPSNDVIEHA